MPEFTGNFFSNIARLFGAREEYGMDDFSRERKAISAEAARLVGCENGVVPEEKLDSYLEMEDKLKDQLYQLTENLRDRRLAVIDETDSLVSYGTLFESDKGTSRLLEEAANRGVSPTMIEVTKASLNSEESRVRAVSEGVASNMMRESGLGR